MILSNPISRIPITRVEPTKPTTEEAAIDDKKEIIDITDLTLRDGNDNGAHGGEPDQPLFGPLEEGHKCCIFHFLVMLVAAVVLGFYTKNKKKHQERIHQLKETMAGVRITKDMRKIGEEVLYDTI